MEAFGEFYEVRIGEVDAFVMAAHILCSLDEAAMAIVEDEGDEVRAQAVGRFKFLDVHQEAGITSDIALFYRDEFG